MLQCFYPLGINQEALLGIIPRQNQQMALLTHVIYKYVLYLFCFFFPKVVKVSRRMFLNAWL